MKLIFAILLTLAAVSPASAFADAFAGSTSDPVDQPPALSGDQTPDVISVAVGYDAAAGAVAADVAFAAPVSIYSPYNVGVDLSTNSSGFCFGGISLFAGTASSATGIVDRTGTTGALPLELTWDATRTTLHLQASSPGLAGVAVNCADASTSIPDSIGHCGNTDCTYISHTYIIDSVAAFPLGPSTAPVLRPTTPAATRVATTNAKPVSPGAGAVKALPKKTRLSVDSKAYACLHRIVVYASSVHRDGATGRIRYLLRGPGVKRQLSARLESGEDAEGHEFRKLKAGSYTLTARYLGGADDTVDPAVQLLASPTVTKHFKLKVCA